MLIEHSRDIILGGGPSADMFALRLGVFHPAFHPCANHRQFQLTENASHLEKRFAHRVCLSVPAINRDAPHNHQPQALFADGVDNLTQLLCASAQSADLQGDDGVALSRRIQEHMEILFHLRVAVLVFKNHFLRARRFQFADLPVDVLLVFASRAARIAIILICVKNIEFQHILWYNIYG